MGRPQLKPGDKVYRVVDCDLPTNEPHTWRVEAATVVAASDRQITLDGASRLRLQGKRFKPHALGLVFFEVEEKAVAHFLSLQRNRVEGADRAIKEATRAITWVHTLYPDLKEQPRGKD